MVKQDSIIHTSIVTNGEISDRRQIYNAFCNHFIVFACAYVCACVPTRVCA